MDTGQLIWDEARRLLARQEADLDTTRTRALSLLSAGGLIGGLFGARLSMGQLSSWSTGWVVIALILFSLSAVITVCIQWPRKWAFSHDLDPWIDDLRQGKAVPLRDATYNLSRDLNQYRKDNRSKLRPLSYGLAALTALLALQVIAWGIALI